MATIIWKEVSPCGTAISRRKERRAAVVAQRRADEQLARKITAAAAGCSVNVARATVLPGMRDQHHGAGMCLPEVAQFAAGHRKSTAVTARS